MVKLMRCRACGYIIEANKLRDFCPACGAERSVFEEYNSEISEERRKKLNRHLHPSLVHFPEAFSIGIIILIIIALLTGGEPSNEFFITAKILIWFLPFTAIGAMLSGIYDGKLRFKKVTTPALKKKMILADIFIAFSIIMLILMIPYQGQIIRLIIILIFAVGCLLCGALLGVIGGTLVSSKLPNG